MRNEPLEAPATEEAADEALTPTSPLLILAADDEAACTDKICVPAEALRS